LKVLSAACSSCGVKEATEKELKDQLAAPRPDDSAWLEATEKELKGRPAARAPARPSPAPEATEKELKGART
jgi:hypothetical protein